MGQAVAGIELERAPEPGHGPRAFSHFPEGNPEVIVDLGALRPDRQGALKCSYRLGTTEVESLPTPSTGYRNSVGVPSKA